MNSVDLRGPRQGKSKAAPLPAYSRKRDGFWIRNQATLREYVLLLVCPQSYSGARREERNWASASRCSHPLAAKRAREEPRATSVRSGCHQTRRGRATAGQASKGTREQQGGRYHVC